ncbi:hypothetical protein ACOME3_000370 [Neoechinorhynchus agilis]
MYTPIVNGKATSSDDSANKNPKNSKRMLCRDSRTLSNGFKRSSEGLAALTKSIEESIAGKRSLPYIRQLDISYHKNISHIPECILSLTSLEILICSYLSLKSIPAGISKLENIIELDLSHNVLEQLPRQIGQLSNLRVLNLSHNQLTSLPCEMQNLQNLVTLRCSSNKLVRLPSTLHRMKNLTYLVLDQNPLQFPPLDVVDRGLLHIMKFLVKNTVQREQPLQNWLANNQGTQSSLTKTEKNEEAISSDEFSRELNRQKIEYDNKRANAHQLKLEMFKQYSENEGERQKQREAARKTHSQQLAIFERRRKDAKEALLYSNIPLIIPWTNPESGSARPERYKIETHFANRRSKEAKHNHSARSSSAHLKSDRSQSKSRYNTNAADSSFTMRRHILQVQEDVRLLNKLKMTLESLLDFKVSLEDLPKSLSDGVLLCQLINRLHPRIVPTIHVQSEAMPSISMAKRIRNVEYFLEGCRKLGATAQPQSNNIADSLGCSSQDIIEAKRTPKLARLVVDLINRSNAKCL